MAIDGERLIEAVKKRDILCISTANHKRHQSEVDNELGVTDKNGG